MVLCRISEVVVFQRCRFERFTCIHIYTIKTQLKYVYVCMCVCINIYMFICTELIEETGRPPGLTFGMWGYFWPGSDKFESWNFLHTFDEVMTCLSHF